jgi:hypothetical protein
MPDRHPLRDSHEPREAVAGRLGHALQALAANLVEERRRVSALERENAELRAELKRLKAET